MRTHEQKLEYMRNYYHANKERIAKQRKKFRDDNSEHYAKQKIEIRKRYNEKRRVETSKQREENKKLYRRKYHKEYRELHGEKLRNDARRRYELNREKRIEQIREYEKTEKGRLLKRIRRHNRRALGVISINIAQQVYEENIKRFGTLTCELCGRPVTFGEDSIEHFIPVSRGGTNERSNLGIAHNFNSKERCNSIKQGKTLEEWHKYADVLK